jgi:Cu+-exporting ATPase
MKNWLLAIAVGLTFTLATVAAVQTKATDGKGKQTAVVCPVSGDAVKNLATAPRYTYKGKTYYFCCKDCLTKFRKSPATYLNRKPTAKNGQSVTAAKSCCSTEQGSSCCSGEKGEGAAGKSCCSEKEATAKNGGQTASVNKQQVSQSPSVESAKLYCPVSGEEVTPEEAIAFEYNGKRYYVCCSNCRRKFLADPETYAKKAEQLSPLQGKPVEKSDS